MGCTNDEASEFVPLTPESRELYASFWAQVGCSTTTEPAMDFLELKEGALQWSERLNLPEGLLVKFRQRLAAAQRDQQVFDLMDQLVRLGKGPASDAAAPADAAPEWKANSKTSTRDLRNELLLQDLRRVAKALRKKTVTVAEYRLKGRSTPGILVKRFCGWNNALAAAGLAVPHPYRIPTLELLENLERFHKAVGRRPFQSDMVKPKSKFSPQPYITRFGSWMRAIKAFTAWKKDGTLPKEKAAPWSLGANISPQLGHRVFKRDNYRCVICGKSPATHPGTVLEADHIKPRSRGGLTVFENLRTLCKRCNIGKGNL